MEARGTRAAPGTARPALGRPASPGPTTRAVLVALRKRLTTALAPAVVRAVRRDSLTLLGADALTDLHRTVRAYEQRKLEGILIEAGCAAGGSAIVIASAKRKERGLCVYDAFGLIPPPSAKDGEDVHTRWEVIRTGRASGIGARTYYGYETDLLGQVREHFARHGVPTAEHNVHLVAGHFQETLRVTAPVVLAHIDCDWYESVMLCLERIAPALVPGGALVIDDYFSWSGCRRAVDEFFADKRHEFRLVQKSRLHVIRR